MRVAFGEYQLDTKTRTLEREGRRIPVQSKVFDLLAHLIERRDQVVSSDELLDALWPGLHVTPAALSTAVQKARQAVDDDGDRQAVIHTEHGKGFRFVAEVTDLSPPGNARSGSTGLAQMSLISELKRRNVFRVAAAYAIVSWLLVEVASVVLPALHLPEWTLTLLVFLVVAGFPLALILAWAFELTPEGIKRETAVDPAESITHLTGRKLDFAIIGLLAAALVYVAVDHYVLDAGPIPAAETVARGKSIAVLPFVNMSTDADQDYFADGISEELLNTLAQFEDLRVVGRTSSFSFKHSDVDLKTIGEALNVDTIIEGSVRKSGNSLRITAQLVNAEDGFHLWSETYSRELDDIFAIQNDIARQITLAVNATFPTTAQDRIFAGPTENIEAYEFFLRGREYYRRHVYSQKDTRSAQRMFEQAVELEPRFALAWVWLSIVHSRFYWFRWDFSPQRLMQAKAAADRAVQIDPELTETHLALAYYHYWGHQAYEQALEELILVEQRLPRDPELFEARGYIKRRQGNWNEAIADLKRAASLDPRNARLLHELGDTYLALRRYDDAVGFYDKALAIDPALDLPALRRAQVGLLRDGDLEPLLEFADRFPQPPLEIALVSRNYSAALTAASNIKDEIVIDQDIYSPKALYAGLAHLGAGQMEEARAAFDAARIILEASLPEKPNHPPLRSSLGLVYARLGMKEAAIREGQKAVELMPMSRDAYVAPRYVVGLAEIYTLVGEYEAAINELEHVVSIPYFPGAVSNSIRLGRVWDPLRSDPRFQDLLRRMNFPRN